MLRPIFLMIIHGNVLIKMCPPQNISKKKNSAAQPNWFNFENARLVKDSYT